MRKLLSPNKSLHLFALAALVVSLTGVIGTPFVSADSNVGGIISENTTWTAENSPYEIVETVQIPEGITLTIEPGVTVTMPGSGDMFLLHGTLVAHGTVTSKITFDGGNNSNFFNAEGSKSNTLLSLEYCIIKNGISFWPPSGYEQYGSFILRYSELIDLTGYSYIWYPGQDVYIEYNRFKNTGGFSIGHDGNIKVYIRYNLFDGKNPELPSYADFWVQNWAAYDSSRTIVKYNSFINNVGIVLKLPGGYDKAAMIATENYWGTQDTQIIDQFIYDKNDDIRVKNYISYLPILTEPHPDTPEVGRPPITPGNPSPANHATGVSINTDLSWTGGDPDAGDTVTYDVYFGTSSNPPLTATIGPYPATQSSIIYDPGTLVDGAKYYWQIVARDNHGITREGPVWDFTTGQPGPAVTWNCPLGSQALIAPNPGMGRPFLSAPADCTGITASAGAELWGIYYLVETGPDAGTWKWYVPGFASSTLTQLEPDELYWVVVSAPCTLTIPQG